MDENKTVENEQDSEFSFMTEKIKHRPPDKKRILARILWTIVCALLFGVIASLVMVFLVPKLQNRLQPDPTPEPPRVVIPADEYETESEEETETESETETETETEAVTETEETETEEATETETEEPSTEAPVEEVPEAVSIDLLPEEYQKLQNRLYDVGEEANRSIVTVTALKSDTDWFNAVYSSEDKESGLIVADTGEEILILTDYAVLRNAEDIMVTFLNEDMADAEVKGYDNTTGLAVLTVDASKISEETAEVLKAAFLANSLYLRKGTMVLALGSPLGTNFTILTGTVTSTQERLFLADAVFTRFETDMIASNSGNGVLVNLRGEVVGYVRKESASEDTISALSISELKPLIERLSNGMAIPYLGVYISTVTKDIAEQYELPQGVYINSVEMDSPAMDANLLSGDVIVEIDGKAVLTAENYRSVLLEHEPGEEMRIVVERLGADGYTKVSCTAIVGNRE